MLWGVASEKEESDRERLGQVSRWETRGLNGVGGWGVGGGAEAEESFVREKARMHWWHLRAGRRAQLPGLSTLQAKN